MRDFKKIKAYQLADHLVLEIYKITKDFPKEEIYGLTSQLRRAAVSISANIAEGASRQHKKDYLNFLFNARASTAEIECLLQLSVKLSFLNQSDFQHTESIRQEAAKTLSGLISAVQQDLLVEV